ncbi:MAG: acetyl-CoA acetyltransferase [Proteobacteria bacterium]|nr:acetyl-CoA acetyltransferase [Pseudomonadota bacterium]
MNDNTPVLVGCGQFTLRDGHGERSPVDLMAETARMAGEDAGPGERLLREVDTLAVMGVIGWRYEDAPGLLSRQLGIDPRRRLYSSIGGNTPQWLVNRSCREIERGDVGAVLITGAEALASYKRANLDGRRLDWERGAGGDVEMIGDPRPGSSDHENAHGLMLPPTIYPLFENALRARAGSDPGEHLRRLGELYAPFSQLASDNPLAWFRQRRSAEEIATPAVSNRLIEWPYTKYMNAVLVVDQSASLILTSVGKARDLGIDESCWVFLHGCGDANDLWYVSERRDFCSSPALAAAGQQALAMAGVGIDDIDCFDLYSCFPSAVQIARNELGIAEDDTRPLTVTGGLACHGGPGNNYTTHAIATLMQRARDKPDSLGLVSGLGWYMTKHSLGIYGATAPAGDTGGASLLHGEELAAELQQRLDAMEHPSLQEQPEGSGSIETYTIAFDRDGAPESGIVVGRLDNGDRFLARVASDPGLLAELVEHEGVGRSGSVKPGGERGNVFTPD